MEACVIIQGKTRKGLYQMKMKREQRQKTRGQNPQNLRGVYDDESKPSILGDRVDDAGNNREDSSDKISRTDKISKVN